MSNEQCQCSVCTQFYNPLTICPDCIRNQGMLSGVHGKCKRCGAWKKFVAKGMCAGCYQSERRAKLSLVRAPDVPA